MADVTTGLVTFITNILQAGLVITAGTGSPENVVTAPVGSIYLRTDGGTNTTLYVKEANTDDTGWAAI